MVEYKKGRDMKVRITMEADVTDLPAFNEDVSVVEIPGAGRENVWGVINQLHGHILFKWLSQNTKEKETSPEIHKAMINHYEDETKLVTRLIDSIKIKYV
jgi:hypothetical protein